MRRTMLARYVTDPDTGRTYPIPAGGADDGDQADGDDQQQQDDDGSSDDADDTDGDQSDDGDDTLGPAGEKALREMKKRARAAERELRKLKAQQDTAQQDDGDQPDADQIRQQVEAEVRAEAAQDRALDKLEAKAARKFRNPDLARKLLADQAEHFLDDTGNPDVEAINEALDELLEDEPYLALDAQGDRRFQGDADGGTRNGSKSGQLTQEQLKDMTPEQIAAAKKDGLLDTLLGRR